MDHPAVEVGDTNVEEAAGALLRIEQNATGLGKKGLGLYLAFEVCAQELAQPGAACDQRGAFLLVGDIGQDDLAQACSVETELLSQLVAQHVPHEGVAGEGQGNGGERNQQGDEGGELAPDRTKEGPGAGAAIRRVRHRGSAVARVSWCAVMPASVAS